ncbi:MAG: PhoH family protein [Bacteroidia bacterium]
MEEIFLEDINLQVFYGANNTHIDLLRQAYPDIQLIARGSSLKISGEKEKRARLRAVIEGMIREIQKVGTIDSLRVSEILRGVGTDRGIDEVILRLPNGKVISARTPAQKRLVTALEKNDIVFAIGPAGTGKTYTAVALAVRALREKRVRKIVLIRPAVEAGESLGFLPGDVKEKIAPYLRPLYDALEEMLTTEKVQQYLEQNVIEIVPLAYMRGRTLNGAFIILDEAQNSTQLQMKMFLTRLGMESKIILTGDVTQIDLPAPRSSGLLHAMRLLQGITGIAMVEFKEEDILRHPLVREILRAYEGETHSG